MGVNAIRRLVSAACRREIPIVTLFAFSSENWKRPAREIHFLFSLFQRYLIHEQGDLLHNGIRISAIGRRDRMPVATCEALASTEAATKACTRLHLRLALDYGGRYEIVEATRSLVRGIANGEIRAGQLTEAAFTEILNPDAVADPDLIIRTGGEQRLSNFLLWQAAYSELYFCPKMWPDFEESDLEEALTDFYSRSRRFGALSRGKMPPLQAACT